MPEMKEEDIAAIEAGRLLFAQPWRFLSSAPNMAALPTPEGIEVAFAGRSNVGKSSLINALVGQKALARTSNTPGRTQELVFFGAGRGLTIVDMPGYGYAQAPKARVADWTKLILDYLRGRPNLRRIYVLIDARHGVKPNDEETLKLLDKAAVSYQCILTKIDKVRPSALAETIAATGTAIAKHPAAHPETIATSAETGVGVDLLRAAIAKLAGG